MKSNQQQRETTRFRYWTRKGYAAFSSLGRCVTIGRLRKNVTERALTKQTEPGMVLSAESRTTNDEGDEAITHGILSVAEVTEQLLVLIRLQAVTERLPEQLQPQSQSQSQTLLQPQSQTLLQTQPQKGITYIAESVGSLLHHVTYGIDALNASCNLALYEGLIKLQDAFNASIPLYTPTSS